MIFTHEYHTWEIILTTPFGLRTYLRTCLNPGLSRVRPTTLCSARTTRVRFSHRGFEPLRAGLDIPAPTGTPDPRLNTFCHGRGWWQAAPGWGPDSPWAKDGAQCWSRKSSENPPKQRLWPVLLYHLPYWTVVLIIFVLIESARKRFILLSWLTSHMESHMEYKIRKLACNEWIGYSYTIHGLYTSNV